MSLRARNLGKRLGRRWVLRGCDLDLHPGTWLGVLGPNGAGKTTLLRLLATVLAPDEGVLYWRGARVGQGARLRRVLGYLPQSFTLPPLPSVAQGLAYLAALKGIAEPDEARECAAALRWADLEQRAGAVPERLSVGLLARAGLAQAVLGRPEVLVLDEPEIALDPAQRVALCLRLRAWADAGGVVITAAHVPGFLEAADAVLLLDGGRPHGPLAIDAFRRTAAGRTWVLPRAPDPAAAGREGTAPRRAGAAPAPDAAAVQPGVADAYTLWRLTPAEASRKETGAGEGGDAPAPPADGRG